MFVPTNAKGWPTMLSWVILIDAEFGLETDILVVAACPAGTVPKENTLGDATTPPATSVFTTVDPQPDRLEVTKKAARTAIKVTT